MFATTVDQKPGDMEGITDIFFEDFKNFPQTRELGKRAQGLSGKRWRRPGATLG